MDWHKLYFGRVSPDEVQDAEWQKLRREMKGRALAEKYDMLRRYYEETSERLISRVHMIDSLQERMDMICACCKFAAQIM